jgi:SsrA-binding protein
MSISKTFADNRRARFDYDIKSSFNAGLVLSGPEVKSVKAGNVSMNGSYVSISQKGATLVNCHIGPYKYAKQDGYNPTKTRSLLLNKDEINQMLGKEKGLTIIPLEIYLGRRGLIKMRIGIGKARKKTDKRDYIKKREANKEIRQSY